MRLLRARRNHSFGPRRLFLSLQSQPQRSALSEVSPPARAILLGIQYARPDRQPNRYRRAGNLPKRIAEYIGRVNSATEAISIARMESPAGWLEPGQTPEFDEYTVVLNGMLRVETKSGHLDVRAGQAIIAHRGEWVRYSSPEAGGAEYIAICVPAFSPDSVHRDTA